MLLVPIVLGLLFFALAPRAAVFLASLATGAFGGALAWVIGLIGGVADLSLASLGAWTAVGALAMMALVHSV